MNALARIQRWQGNSVALLYEVFGEDLDEIHPLQREPLWALDRNPRVTIAGAQGTGKGRTAARALWVNAIRHAPSKGAVLSATGTNIRVNVWGELQRLYQRSELAQAAFRFDATQIVSRTDPHNHFIIGRTAASRSAGGGEQVSEAAAGMYADHTLTCVDEASGVHDAVYDAVEGTANTIWRKLLYEGNPLRRVGRFAGTHLDRALREGWIAFRWSKEDFPWTSSPEARAIWEADLRRWGPNSARARARIFGKFPLAGSVDTLISEDDVRWCLEHQGPLPEPESAPLVFGVDVARFGDDWTVIFVMRANTLLDGVRLAKSSTTQTTAVCLRLFEKYRARQEEDWRDEEIDVAELAEFRVDTTGVGGGVADELRDAGMYVVDVDNGAAPIDDVHNRYANRGAACWDSSAERFAQRKMDWSRCPPDLREDLAAQLSSRQYTYPLSGRGRMGLVSKEQMRKRGQGSPDVGDAGVLVTCAPETIGSASIGDSIGFI